jgi:hypothetical protein
VDQAKYAAYNPELEWVHRVNCLRGGGGHCGLVVRQKHSACDDEA